MTIVDGIFVLLVIAVGVATVVVGRRTLRAYDEEEEDGDEDEE